MSTHTVTCPNCGETSEFANPQPKAVVDRILVFGGFSGFFKSYFHVFASGVASSTERSCSSCYKSMSVGWIYKETAIVLHPRFLLLIPNEFRTYKAIAKDNLIEIVGMFGSRKGSVPLAGASFSVHGAGLFRLGVGDIVIRGRNTEELVWKNVFRAKAVRDRLEQLAHYEAEKVSEVLCRNPLPPAR